MAEGEKELKIIGITGSRGKSSVAYIVYEYLKQKGYKVELYSSVKIDSPRTLINPEEGCEVAINSKEEVEEILSTAKEYGAEYLVLEVNESTIEKGIVKDIPIDVRVLTNLNSRHNLERYEEREYVEIKKSFFRDISKESVCVYGIQDYGKETYEELMNINENKKVTFTSNFIANIKGIKREEITNLLIDIKETEKGYSFTVKMGSKTYTFKVDTKVKYNILNYIGALSTLKALEVANKLKKIDYEKFSEVIRNIKIPGRAVTYKVNNRMIVIDLHLAKMLENLKELKKEGEIKKIKVVVGAVGSGFKTWDKRFNEGKHYQRRHKIRKQAMEILEKYADYVYLTENDNAGEEVKDICEELKEYLKEVGVEIIIDREEAIKKAIKESEEGDVIFISGRGNRRVLVNGKTTMKLVKDSEVVEKELKELGWK